MEIFWHHGICGHSSHPSRNFTKGPGSTLGQIAAVCCGWQGKATLETDWPTPSSAELIPAKLTIAKPVAHKHGQSLRPPGS